MSFNLTKSNYIIKSQFGRNIFDVLYNTVHEDKETKLIAQRNIANIFFAVDLNMQF